MSATKRHHSEFALRAQMCANERKYLHSVISRGHERKPQMSANIYSFALMCTHLPCAVLCICRVSSKYILQQIIQFSIIKLNRMK